MAKKLTRIFSCFLAVVMILTSSSVTSLAETIGETNSAETAVQMPSTVDDKDTTVMDTVDSSETGDVTGNEVDTPEDTDEGTVFEDEISQDVSGDEAPDYDDEFGSDDVAEDVSGDDVGDPSDFSDVAPTGMKGTISITIGKSTKTYKNGDIATGLATLTGVDAATVTLKSNIFTDTTLSINSKKVTLNLNKKKLTQTGTNIPAIKVNGSTQLTVTGAGTIAADDNYAGTKSQSGTINVAYNAGLTIADATINGVIGIRLNGSAPSLTVKGGKINAEIIGVAVGDDAKVQISGGSISGKTVLDIAGENSEVTINKGSLMAKNPEGDAVAISLTAGTLRIAGGSVAAEGLNAYGLSVDSTFYINSTNNDYSKASVFITGGSFSAKGTNTATGVDVAGEPAEFWQNGGKFTVKAADTAYGFRVSSYGEKIEYNLQKGSFDVKTTGSSGRAFGISMDGQGKAYQGTGTDKSRVNLSRDVQFTVDGALTIGAYLPSEKADISIRNTSFKLGQSKTASDMEVYGIVSVNAKAYLNGIDINIDSAANKIYGIYTNNCISTNNLNIVIKAKNAEEAVGIYQYCGFGPDKTTIGDTLICAESTGTTTIPFAVPKITITGGYRNGYGICVNRDYTSGATGTAPYFSVSRGVISLTTFGKQFGEISGISVKNHNPNSGKANIKIDSCDITVSTAKGAVATDSPCGQLNAINIHDLDLKGLFDPIGLSVLQSKLVVTDTQNTNVKAVGINAERLAGDGITEIIRDNTITVKGSKSAKAPYHVGYGVYLDNIEETQNTVDISNNKISVSAYETGAIYVDNYSIDISDCTIQADGTVSSAALIGILGNTQTIRNSSLKASISYEGSYTDYLCSCYGAFFERRDISFQGTLIVENCDISAKASKAYMTDDDINAIQMKRYYEGPLIRIHDSEIAMQQKSNSSSAISAWASEWDINNTQITSSGTGVCFNSPFFKNTIENSSITSGKECLYFNYEDHGYPYNVEFKPETVLKSSSAGVVNDHGNIDASLAKHTYEYVDKEGNCLAKGTGIPISTFADQKYVKVCDKKPIKLDIRTNGVNGSNLFSKSGALEPSLTLSEGMELLTIGKEFSWEIMKSDGSFAEIGDESCLSGNNPALKMGSNVIRLTYSFSYVDTEDGNTYDDSISVTRTISFNPEVTYHAYRIGEEASAGHFADGSTVKTVPIVYGTRPTCKMLPGKDGCIFYGWYVADNEGEYIVNIDRDLDYYANFVPEGFYVTDDSDNVITDFNADGKSIQLSDRYYTGSKLLLPEGYEVHYGRKTFELSELTIKGVYNINPGEATVTVTPKSKNYKGSITLKFNIVPAHIHQALYSYSLPYTGKVIDFNPDFLVNRELYSSGKRIALKNGKDYTATYYYKNGSGRTKVTEIKKAGDYEIEYKGKNGYAGSLGTVLLKIDPTMIALKKEMITVSDYEYTGLPYSPGREGDFADCLTVMYKGQIIDPSKYSVTYRAKGDDTVLYSVTEVGTYEVVIAAGAGSNLYGIVKTTFSITGVNISKWSIRFKNNILKLVYSPEMHMEDVFEISGFTNESGNGVAGITSSDYDIKYYSTAQPGVEIAPDMVVDAGTVTVCITGKGKYYGTINKKIQVKPYNLATGYKMVGDPKLAGNITVTTTNPNYVPEGAKTSYVVALGTGDKKETVTQYTTVKKYKNNKKVGTAYATIVGKGNLTGSITVPFDILPERIGLFKLECDNRAVSKKAGDYKTKFRFIRTLYNAESKLKAGKDYSKTVVYTDEHGNVLNSKSKLKAGQTINVTINGTGNYTGSVTGSFTVYARNLSSTTIKIKDQELSEREGSYWSDEAPIVAYVELPHADISVKHKTWGTLEYGKDYVVEGYSNNRSAGTAYVYLRGIGDYCGTMKVPFKINAAKVKTRKDFTQ